MNHHPAAGTIAAGMRADLVVLDRNISAGPVDGIADARVSATICSADAVYQR